MDKVSENGLSTKLFVELYTQFLVYPVRERRDYIAFSSLYEIISPFTRDFESIKQKLQQLEEYDKTSIETALHGVNRLVLGEWGSATPCQVTLC
ncbi:unnamed protein product [Timema podura]|uniref:Integrator complex subunit 14 n=1 Tax=Timema podura TaxID=61482 RepID=A0ABN7PK74_TIMPD|nr:unnamed protein product [Timema podura]